MQLEKLILINNNCYKSGKKHTVRGLMIHSTGANNKKLSRYVGPDDGKLGVNPNNNHWNRAKPEGINICVHGFIGVDKNGEVRTYQTLPWDMVGWHSGVGRLGSGKNGNNTGYIGVEICEDNLQDGEYFQKVYTEAAELFAHLCNLYRLDPLKQVICHSEGHKMGIASNHADVMHWFPKYGKNMDTFRSDIAALMQKDPGQQPSSPSTEVKGDTHSDNDAQGKLYRIQVGAFSSKSNAEDFLSRVKQAGFEDAFIKHN